MESRLERDYEELGRLAAIMCPIVSEAECPGTRRLNLSGDDCYIDCTDCGYYDNPLRNALIRLGVEVDGLHDFG